MMQGEGTGIVELYDGKVTGGDTVLAYTGHTLWTEINLRRVLPRSGTRRDNLPFSASTTSI
ncbi:hypothetical protein SAMN05443248_8032 [Bradyrhizobium erythrophlei]|uniref:Uncharacterized protein n=1 Tax=Bradyrhizobium erythrophlei TaxID=1437360 RepID=A0A1M5Y900_9BRAD|nr:hypothetical protein SAMN05443248_8032 [Bradyrhizobium erythrophlei]